MGYVREDGRVGTRNYIAVVAASNCAAHTAELIAHSFRRRGTCRRMSMAWWRFRTAKAAGMSIGRGSRRSCGARWPGVLAHPNVAAAMILGLGCEVNQIDHYLGPNAPRSSRLVGMTLQGSGGTRRRASKRRAREIRALIEQCAGGEAHRSRRRRRSCWG